HRHLHSPPGGRPPPQAPPEREEEGREMSVIDPVKMANSRTSGNHQSMIWSTNSNCPDSKTYETGGKEEIGVSSRDFWLEFHLVCDFHNDYRNCEMHGATFTLRTERKEVKYEGQSARGRSAARVYSMNKYDDAFFVNGLELDQGSSWDVVCVLLENDRSHIIQTTWSQSSWRPMPLSKFIYTDHKGELDPHGHTPSRLAYDDISCYCNDLSISMTVREAQRSLFKKRACLCAPARVCCTTGRNKLLLTIFDGFRWDYDRDVDTPNLDKMAEEGVKAAYVTPPFLTITSPTHFTLLSGRYIENHGVIHNVWFNTTTRQRKEYYMTQFVDEYWDNGSLPIWITAQRQGLKTGSLHFPGTAATYQNETIQVREVEPRAYDYTNESVWRENVDKVIKDWFKDADLDFVTLYFGDPDETGHKKGPDSPERREAVKKVDRTLGYLRETVERHGLSDHLNIIITADHGMSTVLKGDQVKQIILTDIPGFSYKDLQFHLIDYGPMGMLLPKEGMLDKIYNALKGGHPNLHVYKKEDMPSRLHYSNHPRVLPIVLIADPGYVINGFYVFQTNNGEHGYDNEIMDMKPFFRAVGPDFHRNLLVGPFETVNVYALMCHLLGIKPEINDGSLDHTKHMLISNGKPCETGDGSESSLQNVFIGLAAVAGFLLLAFAVVTSYNVHKRRRVSQSPYLQSFPCLP
ncbi:hypothetical protein DNTS_033440, partial [Danionella cerebrum]